MVITWPKNIWGLNMGNVTPKCTLGMTFHTDQSLVPGPQLGPFCPQRGHSAMSGEG